MADRLRVCALYPDLMNIYADRGNLALLEKRCRWRGLEFELAVLDAPGLAAEGRAAGLTSVPGLRIPATADHVGSAVVVFRA